MVRLTKIYTKTGDGGETSLIGGARVPKDDLRVEAYGTVDELNATIGLARAFNERASREDSGGSPRHDTAPTRRDIDAFLRDVQQQLFDLGAALASPPEARRRPMPTVGADDVAWLERTVDRFNEQLEPLRSFVLPAGDETTAALHLARTVARRAERVAVALARREPVDEYAVPYLNRLSDALFVAARVTWQLAAPRDVEDNEGEELWDPMRR